MKIQIIPVNNYFDSQQIMHLVELNYDEFGYTGNADHFLLKQIDALALHYPLEEFHIILPADAPITLKNTNRIPPNITIIAHDKSELKGTGIMHFDYTPPEHFDKLSALRVTLQNRMDRYGRDCPQYMKLNFKLSQYVHTYYPHLHHLEEFQQFIDVLDFIFLQHNMESQDNPFVENLLYELLELFSHIDPKNKTRNLFFSNSEHGFSTNAFKAMTKVLCAMKAALDGLEIDRENNCVHLLKCINEFKATDGSQLILARVLQIAGISIIAASCMALPFILTLSVISPVLVSLGTCILIFGGMITAGLGFKGEDLIQHQRNTKTQIIAGVEHLSRRDISAEIFDKAEANLCAKSFQ